MLDVRSHLVVLSAHDVVHLLGVECCEALALCEEPVGAFFGLVLVVLAVLATGERVGARE